MTEYKIKATIEASVAKFKRQIDSAVKSVQRFKRVADQTKDVELNADDKKLQKTIKVAKKSLDAFSNKKVKAKLDASIQDLQQKVLESNFELDKLNSKEVTPEIKLQKQKLTKDIAEAEAKLSELEKKRVNIDVNADNSKFNRVLKVSKASLEALNRSKAKAIIDVDNGVANSKIKRTKEELKSIPNKTRSRLDVDTGLSIPTIYAFKKSLDALPNKKTTKVDVDTNGLKKAYAYIIKANDNFQRQMGNLANMFRVFGTVGSNMVGGLLTSSFSILIPVIASVVPVVFALLNAIKVLTGGVLALGGAVAIAGAGFVAFGAMAISAIKMLNDGTLQASSATNEYKKALDGVKSAWTDIIKQNQSAIFTTLANGLNTVKTAMQSLQPFFSGISRGMEEASQSVLKWAENSSVASRFFNMMNTTGVSVFNKLLSAAGGFGDGLVNVFTQLAPLFQWSADWLDRLGQSFSNWANSAAGENSITRFIEYTKTNLPIIGNIFKNVFVGINNLMNAFSGSSTGIFQSLEQMTAKFREWSEQVGQSQGFKDFVSYIQTNGPLIMQLIGNIARGLVAFATAMAPIASAVLRVAVAITGWIANLFEAHPATAQLVGVIITLVGAFRFLIAPILAVMDFLGPLAARLVALVTKFGWAKTGTLVLSKAMTSLKGPIKLVTAIFQLLFGKIGLIRNAITGLVTVFGILGGPITIVIGVIAALIAIFVLLWNKNEGFRNFIINAWNAIKTFMVTVWNVLKTVASVVWNAILKAITTAVSNVYNFIMIIWNQIVAYLQGLWNGIIAIATTVWNLLVTIITTVFTTIMTIVMTIWTAIWAFLSTIWNTIITIATTIWNLLVTVITTVFTTIMTIAMTIWNAIWTFLQTLWNTIVTVATKVWNAITTAISTALQAAWSFISNIWNTIWSFLSSILTTIWNKVVSIFTQVVSTISDKMSQAWNFIVTKGMQWVSTITSTLINFVNRVVQGFVNVVNKVSQGMTNAVNKVKSFVDDFVSAGADMIRGLMRGIGNMARDLAEKAASVAKGALNAAKRALGIHSPSREFMDVGMYSMLGFVKGIDNHSSKVIRNVSNVADKVVDAFQPTLNAPDISSITGNLSNLGGNINAQVQHTHSIETSPNMKTVKVEFDVNNDALTSIVNGRNAKRNSEYYL
ncbi:membrane protein [Staphylococcus aureus]|uniref:membrane protein n=1 Tax=Staphylococcus aureus TaxID=1280 RepID=UPI00066B9EAC|nr:membrane protein [Staphylococcus aureus]